MEHRRDVERVSLFGAAGAKRVRERISARRRLLLLTLIMLGACAIAMTVITVVLYRHAIQEHREMLQVTARSRARFIEAVARHDARMADTLLAEHPDHDAFDATLGQIIEAHDRFEGFGETGEFTLARRDGDAIVFLLRHRHAAVERPVPVAFDSDLAEPMRMALEGLSGTIIGLDYRAETVVAAYEPVAELNLGIVAKLDLSEVREPFVRAGLAAVAAAIPVILGGMALFIWIGNPMIEQLEKQAQDLKSEVSRRRTSEAAVRKRLAAITEPDGDLDALELSDIIDAEAIQPLMEDFHAIAGMSSAILDSKGNILVSVGWQDICTRFHRTCPETEQHCIESATRLSQKATAGEFRTYRCKNNMWEMASPIEVGGRHVGNIHIGQYFRSDEVVDVETFRERARRYGFDEEEYLAALSRVPRFDRETVNVAMSFYSKLAVMISALSFSNIELSRALAERERTEHALGEANLRFRETVRGGHIGLWDWVLATNEARYSREWKAQIGYEENEIDNEPGEWRSRVHPDDLQGTLQAVEEAVAECRDDYAAEFRFRHKDGSWRWIASRGSVLTDDTGKAVRVVGSHVDITHRKLAEAELREAHALLERRVAERTAELKARTAEAEALNSAMANVMEDLRISNANLKATGRDLMASNKELDAFSYSVSHDLRAPLRHIDGFVRLLLKREKGRLDPTSSHYLDTIAEASNRMGRLIDDLLAFSRTGRAEAHFQRVDSNEIVREVRKDLSSLTEGRRVTWKVGDLPAVEADRGLLRLVWENLIGNAIKYTDPCEEARIEIGATREGVGGASREMTFFVRDNGVGFDPQYAHRLFGVFQRLHGDDEFEGTGIGLATVHRIVQRHGGRVWAEGKVDHGASFYFALKGARGVDE